MNTENDVIAVFDSGVGGLSVLNKLVAQFPHQDFLYFGDTANMPYGNKPQEVLRELISQWFDVLIKRYNPRALVIACNTASVVYQLSGQQFKIPVIGIIHPFVTQLQLPTNKKLGVLATPLTVTSGFYTQELRTQFPYLGLEKLRLFSGQTLAQIIESGITDQAELVKALQPILKPVIDWQPDTLILGCTHYPLISNIIQTLIGNTTKLIDPADYMTTLIPTSKLSDQSQTGSVRYVVSGSPQDFIFATKHFKLPHLNINQAKAFNN